MSKKEKDDLLKDAVAAIGVIKAQFDAEVIRNYEIPPLVKTKTGEDIGFGVKMQLSTRYDYDEELLTEWKRLLKADDWYISVKCNQLHVTFKVRYKKNPKLDIKIEDCNLSVRTTNICKANGIDTLGDLCKLHKTDWLKFRNGGKKSLIELDDLLHDNGLDWAEWQ